MIMYCGKGVYELGMASLGCLERGPDVSELLLQGLFLRETLRGFDVSITQEDLEQGILCEGGCVQGLFCEGGCAQGSCK